MNYREHYYNQMPTGDAASAMGEAVEILLIQSAGYLQALKWAKEAFDKGDIEQAKREVNNALSEFRGETGLHGNLENLGYLIELCIPRTSNEEPHSY